jgi:hypothetical protein
VTGWVAFEGRVEALEWGRSTYTILRLPPDVERALGPVRRVEGEIADHPVNLAITRAPVVDGAFLWAGRSLLKRVGINPGEAVEVRLRPANDDQVELADDIALALRVAGLTADWAALTPGKRRGFLHRIETARTAPTRTKRIAELLAGLSGDAQKD